MWLLIACALQYTLSVYSLHQLTGENLICEQIEQVDTETSALFFSSLCFDHLQCVCRLLSSIFGYLTFSHYICWREKNTEFEYQFLVFVYIGQNDSVFNAANMITSAENHNVYQIVIFVYFMNTKNDEIIFIFTLLFIH